MKHTSYRKGSAKSSFVQAILLLVFLIVGVLGYKILKKGDIAAGLSSFINMDVQNLRPLQAMKDEDKLALQKKFGGFWVSATADSTAAVKKYDCLELRDNGIIWQVITWHVRYPSGDSSTFHHVRYGYLNPYSVSGDGINIVNEVRTIRQIFIHDGDTCFGASQVDELWQSRRNDSVFVLNRKVYTPYKGELSQFFPAGMIDLIDKLINKDCPRNFSAAYIIKQQLSGDLTRSGALVNVDTNQIKHLLDDYFRPAFIDEVIATIPYYPVLPDSLAIPCTFTDTGKVIVSLSKGKRVQASHFESLLLNELETWPIYSGTGKTHRVTYTIHLPLP